MADGVGRETTRPLNRAQRWVAAALFASLVWSRLAVAWPHLTTEPLTLPRDWRSLTGDDITYHLPAINLVLGNGYSGCLGPPYEPAVSRTPIYPLVLALTYATIGPIEGAVVGLNVVFDVFATFILFAVARRRLAPWWALGFLGLAILLAPWSHWLGQRISEPLTTLLVAAVLWLSVPSPKLARWLVLGVCLGALVLCRPVFVFLPLVLAAWAAAFAVPLAPARRGLVFTTVLAGATAIWAPWVVRNALVLDRFVPLSSSGSGLSLWLGTWEDGRTPRWTIERDRDGVVTRQVAARAFRSEDERQHILPLLDSYFELYFTNGGITLEEPNEAFRALAIERIREDPLEWLKLRTRGTAILLFQPRYLAGRLTSSQSFWRALGWVIGILALAGTVSSIRRVLWQPLMIVLLYTWFIHFPTHGEDRYLAPAYGAVIMLAVLALERSFDWFRARHIRARPS